MSFYPPLLSQGLRYCSTYNSIFSVCTGGVAPDAREGAIGWRHGNVLHSEKQSFSVLDGMIFNMQRSRRLLFPFL